MKVPILKTPGSTVNRKTGGLGARLPHRVAGAEAEADGRIRVPEVLAAVSWTCRVLKDPNDLLQHPEALPLSAIDDSNDEGRQLLASAQRILEAVGKQGAEVITAEDTADTKKIFTGAHID